MATPANCVVCGAHADGIRRFIDFNFNIDYYGAVFFCEECVVNVMFGLGFVREELLESAKGVNRILDERIEHLVEENGKLRNSFSVLSGITDNSLPLAFPKQELADGSSTAEGNDPESSGTESDSTKQDSIPGFEDFSIFASNDGSSTFTD